METQKPIIHHKVYLNLKKLIKDPESLGLVIGIVDNCDIEESIVPILCLMSQSRNLTYSYGTNLSKANNLVHYLFSISKYQPQMDLKFVMEVYKLSLLKRHMKEDPKIIKFILAEYETNEVNPLYSFKAQLNPKNKK
jgi:aspartokinase